MSVESLDASEEFAIIAKTDEDLVVILHSLLYNTEWTVSEFEVFELCELSFGEFAFGAGGEVCHDDTWEAEF